MQIRSHQVGQEQCGDVVLCWARICSYKNKLCTSVEKQKQIPQRARSSGTESTSNNVVLVHASNKTNVLKEQSSSPYSQKHTYVIAGVWLIQISCLYSSKLSIISQFNPRKTTTPQILGLTMMFLVMVSDEDSILRDHSIP